MAHVTFYEKIGCGGNARQKQLLLDSGHQVMTRGLRNRAWTNHALLEFLAGLPVAQWFHPSAPAIKNGEIVPAELDEPTALALLRDNPLLIRRPLLQVGDERRVGFDAKAIHDWIGLVDVPVENLEECRHAATPRVTYAHTASGAAYACRVGVEPDDARDCGSH